ncbi:Hpt domain-containing protein [Pseudomonas aeruginosa]|uniref:Hpt domain-containing protein n=1 Tax=Pseudomonas aeruginosa TaxID=287 RepID=UPI0004F2D39C|nr:Hpt domain-containing protein [Pseudomonas aeruginosa]EKV4549587.1 Hpt domain-containing protein [Pseudomonas aeruginosa]ELK6186708.1 Hpt domain-containing protein [Pseudomonas aeruginosa]KSO43463.1 histidine phosphotransferase [Pseudomonas aeruginosa]MBG4556381.1 Hpt domain-containing protein [Pseudomonas aeruginosa]MBG6315636.1 Hpt domain-containing protein [Pseudomonas aeruginosa]
MKELGSESPMESLFDIRSLEAITGGEPAALQRLLETLLASSRDDRTRLAELLELADLQGVAELAHRIKGAARVVGSSLLVESCSCLEKACQNPSKSSERIANLASSLEGRLSAFEISISTELAKL